MYLFEPKMPKIFLNKQRIFASIGQHEKMKRAKHIFKINGLRIVYEKQLNKCEYCNPIMSRNILIMKGMTEVAHFGLSSECLYDATDCFTSSASEIVSMSIGIDDDDFEYLKGIQLSRIMIWSMLCILMKENVDFQQDVYIDTDASCGFWDAIGMKINNGPKGKGYEKKISLNNMKDWCMK